jgi:hypothetical protein
VLPWPPNISNNPTFSDQQSFDNQKILAQCSDNHNTCETIKYEHGNQLADAALSRYRDDEAMLMPTLVFMENMLRMDPDSKPELLATKTDFKVEKIVEATADGQPELHEQAQTVLNLLRDIKQEKNEVEDEPAAETPDQAADNSVQDIQKAIPMDIQKILKQGRLLLVYGEDKVCRSMHLFVSKDLLYIKCKHPKENFIKQKWIMPIHQVKDIKYGYDKDSPIVKASGFFKKAPKVEKCFAIFGPLKYDEYQNFHVVCDDAATAKKWHESLSFLFNEYKKILVNNLRKK